MNIPHGIDQAILRKVLLWQQQIEVKINNRKTSRGLKSKDTRCFI